jgi:hypothetical protein
MIATLPCNPYHEGNNALKRGRKSKGMETKNGTCMMYILLTFVVY